MTARVLLVEDDARLATMVADYLGEAGFRVVRGRHRRERPCELIGTEGFDAVILDLMLPDADGLDLCRSIRAKSDIPLLMLTARGDPLDRVVGLELGADDYLPKPFEPRELLARLRAILRRRNTPGFGRRAALWPAGDRQGCARGARRWAAQDDDGPPVRAAAHAGRARRAACCRARR